MTSRLQLLCDAGCRQAVQDGHAATTDEARTLAAEFCDWDAEQLDDWLEELLATNDTEAKAAQQFADVIGWSFPE